MALGDLPPWLQVTPQQHLAAAQLRFSNDAERTRIALADRAMQNQEQWRPEQLEAQRENYLLRNQLGQQALQARQQVAETAAQARRDTALAALQWHTQQTAALKDYYGGKVDSANARIDELTRHNQALEQATAGQTKHKTDVEDQVSSFWKDFTPGTDTTGLMKKYPLVTQDAGIRSFLAQEAIRQRTADNQAEITKRANERNAKTSNPTATVTPTRGPYKGMVLKGDPTSDLLRTNAPGYVPPTDATQGNGQGNGFLNGIGNFFWDSHAGEVPPNPNIRGPGLNNALSALRAAQEQQPGALVPQPVSGLPAPQNPYKVGARYGNLRYKGGDPSDQTSWDGVK